MVKHDDIYSILHEINDVFTGYYSNSEEFELATVIRRLKYYVNNNLYAMEKLFAKYVNEELDNYLAIHK